MAGIPGILDLYPPFYPGRNGGFCPPVSIGDKPAQRTFWRTVICAHALSHNHGSARSWQPDDDNSMAPLGDLGNT